MSAPLVAIGLDACNPRLLEDWMDRGLLPNLARFRAEGAFGTVNNVRYYRTETSWITFLTGALPGQTGEWGHVQYDPARYAAEERSAYAFNKYPPFYAYMPAKRVAVFDPPLARLVDGVNGVQVLGWGTEANQCLRTSQPQGLMAELLARHGLAPSGGTALFQWVRTDRAEDIHTAMASRGILVRLFDVPASLRFGLPGSETEWQRLEWALAGVAP